MRVVSLACSNTEIVCALGCADLLVGVDSHSDTPKEVVTRLPKLGPDLNIDIAAVAALKPDLVLTSLTVPGHEKVIAGLEAAGLPYLAPEPVRLADVYGDVLKIARHLGVPERGERLVREMRSALTERQPDTKTKRDTPKLLVQWWPKPVIAPGQLSWVDDLIRIAGGQNPLGNEAVKSRPLTDEEVTAINPDAIVLSWCGVAPDKVRPEVVLRNSAWQEVRAVQRGHIYCVPEAYLGRPGPGLMRGFRALQKIVEDQKGAYEDRQLTT